VDSEGLIPNRWRDERFAVGIESPEELAARADVDPTWYRHIEAGRVLPTATELERLTSRWAASLPVGVRALLPRLG
jgi:predicted transcriptional regulator